MISVGVIVAGFRSQKPENYVEKGLSHDHWVALGQGNVIKCIFFGCSISSGELWHDRIF